jgi:hypothetical protein
MPYCFPCQKKSIRSAASIISFRLSVGFVHVKVTLNVLCFAGSVSKNKLEQTVSTNFHFALSFSTI